MIQPGDLVRLSKDGRDYRARVVLASANHESLLLQLDEDHPGVWPLGIAPDPVTGHFAVTLMLSRERDHYRDIVSGETFEVQP